MQVVDKNEAVGGIVVDFAPDNRLWMMEQIEVWIIYDCCGHWALKAPHAE